MVLARLDQVFIAGSVLGFLACRWIAEDRRQSAKRLLTLGVCFSVPIGLYLLANLAYCGLLLPVSGASKLSLGHLGRPNLRSLQVVLSTSAGTEFWLDRFFRLAQVLVPAAAAAVFLLVPARHGRVPRDEFRSFMTATAVGVLALCGTVFLFSDAPAYGSWSLPVPVLFVSLAGLSVLPARSSFRPSTSLLLGAAVCGVIAVFCALHRQPEYHEWYRRFYMGREAIVEAYRGREPKVIENDDGIIGFATRFHTLSAFNFATDKELHEAIRENRLLALARDRGYDRIASLVYLAGFRDRTGEAPLKYFAWSHRSDRSAGASYELEYFDPDLPFAIARITYLPPAAAPGRPLPVK